MSKTHLENSLGIRRQEIGVISLEILVTDPHNEMYGLLVEGFKGTLTCSYEEDTFGNCTSLSFQGYRVALSNKNSGVSISFRYEVEDDNKITSEADGKEDLERLFYKFLEIRSVLPSKTETINFERRFAKEILGKRYIEVLDRLVQDQADKGKEYLLSAQEKIAILEELGELAQECADLESQSEIQKRIDVAYIAVYLLESHANLSESDMRFHRFFLDCFKIRRNNIFERKEKSDEEPMVKRTRNAPLKDMEQVVCLFDYLHFYTPICSAVGDVKYVC